MTPLESYGAQVREAAAKVCDDCGATYSVQKYLGGSGSYKDGKMMAADQIARDIRAMPLPPLPDAHAPATSPCVYLVATGQTHEGRETYTRHDSWPPLCDYETLHTAPAPVAALPERPTPSPLVETYLDQCDADHAAREWLESLMPRGRERIFWQYETFNFEARDGRLYVITFRDRPIAAAIVVRDSMNRSQLLRWHREQPAPPADDVAALRARLAAAEAAAAERGEALGMLRKWGGMRGGNFSATIECNVSEWLDNGMRPCELPELPEWAKEGRGDG